MFQMREYLVQDLCQRVCSKEKENTKEDMSIFKKESYILWIFMFGPILLGIFASIIGPVLNRSNFKTGFLQGLMMEKRPEFDKKYANEITGKRILVGVTTLNKKGEKLETIQFHGKILRVNARDGIVILRADTNQEYALPPDLRSIFKAAPGEYKLRSTGEVVINPDYSTMWTITAPS